MRLSEVDSRPSGGDIKPQVELPPYNLVLKR